MRLINTPNKRLVSKETKVVGHSGELKHRNLVSRKLIRVKFLPRRDNEANVSSL